MKGVHDNNPIAQMRGSALGLIFLKRLADSEPTATPTKPAMHVMIPNRRLTLYKDN